MHGWLPQRLRAATGMPKVIKLPGLVCRHKVLGDRIVKRAGGDDSNKRQEERELHREWVTDNC